MAVRSAFPRDHKLTAIAIAYSNPDQAMIADVVMPRSEVGTEDFEWTQYPKGQGFTVPDTSIGRMGEAERVLISGSEVAASTQDQGLIIPVTNKDIKNAPPEVDPRGSATELGTKLLLLRREIRVATAVTDATKYSAANVKNLSTLDAGAHKWSDKADSDPLVDIRNWMAQMIMKPNTMAMGYDCWNALSSHPKVVSAALGNNGTSGFAPKARVCELLEITDLLVGESWVNPSKPGEAVALTRTWGNAAVLFYKDSTASFSNKAMTFALTAQVGTRVSGEIVVPAGKMGLDGGLDILTGEKVKELIIAQDCGLLIQNPV